MVIVFIGLSSSVAKEIPIVRGQLHPPAHESVQGLFVIMEEVSTHTELQTRSLWLCPHPHRSPISSGFPRRRQLRVSRYSNGRYMLRVTGPFGLTVRQHFVT
jgi:hypothetical protein